MVITMLKILHCGDLHLDSPFSGLSHDQSEARRQELRDTFTYMMNYAQTENIDLVLIAGDLFDCGFVYRDTLALLSARFSALACPVVISPGNHDPYTAGSLYAGGKLPENVHVFTAKEPSRIDFPALDVSVTGYAFTSDRYEENPLDMPCPLHPKHINILLGHADLGAPLSKYAPMPVKSLEMSGFAYAALGHVHNPPKAIRVGKTTAAYCGVAEGRGFDEPGFGGARLVNIERTDHGISVSTKRLVFSHRRYMIEQVEVDGAERDEDVAEKIGERVRLQGYGPETALRVILRGAVALTYTPNVTAIAERCRGELYLLEVQDMTVPVFDADYLREDKTIRGELYRALEEKLGSADERERKTAALALQYGLGALDGNLN